MLRKYNGKVACDGIAIGKVYELKKYEHFIEKTIVNNIAQEKQRFFSAHKTAIDMLETLYNKTLQDMSENEAMIFKAHKMMLEDEEYIEKILHIIETEKANAEYAIERTSRIYSKEFEQIQDPYFKERIQDLTDASNIIIDLLINNESEEEKPQQPCIIVADNLTPKDAVQLDKSNVIAFVMRKGSIHSHTAILARTMAIPSLVNVPVSTGVSGMHALVNTYDGTFILEPDDNHIMRADKLIKLEKENKNSLKEYIEKVAVTKSGVKVQVCANVSGVEDVLLAIENGAEGIGLFRSEFLYLDENNMPEEQAQFEVYKKAVELMDNKNVVIRIPDIGDDKKLNYILPYKEVNPALGYRGMRAFFEREDLLKTHLRAVLRASAYGNISIMLPMICSVWEVNKTKDILKDIMKELKVAKIPFKKVPLGIMIETPAAVMIADELAKEVDFFSIGTNDLTQYTLVADRQNSSVERFYNPYHPAVLKMVDMAVKAALNNNVAVSVCGDLASDVNAIKTLIQYGVQHLSVSPKEILNIKKAVCELN